MTAERVMPAPLGAAASAMVPNCLVRASASMIAARSLGFAPRRARYAMTMFCTGRKTAANRAADEPAANQKSGSASPMRSPFLVRVGMRADSSAAFPVVKPSSPGGRVLAEEHRRESPDGVPAAYLVDDPAETPWRREAA